MLAPSTMCLSAYNALCAHGPQTTEGVAHIIRMMGGTPIEDAWVAGALDALNARALVRKDGPLWNVLDPLRRIPFARDRQGAGWCWMIRTRGGGALQLCDDRGVRSAAFDEGGAGP